MTSGLLLFVVCWSGTVAVFSYEIDSMLNPSIRGYTSEETDWDRIADAAKNAYPNYKISSIERANQKGYAAQIIAITNDGTQRRIFVDTNTFTVTFESSYFNVQRFFRSLHMSFFDPETIEVLNVPIGYLTVLVTAFPLFGLLVTSLVFFKRWWTAFFDLRLKQGSKSFWNSVHKMSGVWSLWFVLIISVTSFWYLAEYYLPTPLAKSEAEISHSIADSKDPITLNRAVLISNEVFPKLTVNSIYYPVENDRKIFILSGHDGAVLTRGRAFVEIDVSNGKVVAISCTHSLSWIGRLKETVDPLHFGNFGGVLTKAIWFFFGLVLSILCLTGLWLYIKRLLRAKRDIVNRTTILSSLATTYFILATAALMGFFEIKEYGLNVNGIQHWPNVPLSVIAFIACWIFVTIFVLGFYTLLLIRAVNQPVGK